MKRIFILLGILLSISTVFSQNIIKAEYFIDIDLGPGKGTPIPNFTQGDIVNFSFTVPTNSLSSGFHFLNTRVVDVNGVWSRHDTRTFYLSGPVGANTTNIVAAEYFIGPDPGTGAGTPINIGSPGSVVTFPVPIPSPLGSGFHYLSIRVRDQEGKWSLFEQRSFYIPPSPVDAPPIVAAEYFFDTDPGIGSASALIVNPTGNIITQTFLVPVPNSLSQGNHILAIRVKDQQGHWSFFAKDTITVSNSATISCPSNTVVAAPAGQCAAVVNGIDPTTTPAGTSYTYTFSGATTGSGSGTASGKTFNAGVTTVTYALTNSPTTTCSFYVTVNPSVTPTAGISIIPSTTICEGTLVTFAGTSTNAGFNPSWQWKKNGINVGTNSNIYRDSTLQNNDAITVAMTSSISCAIPQTVTSAPVTMTVHGRVIPSISITASATAICPGQQVTFTATSTNSGSQPIYQWVKNGSYVGNNSPTYQTSALQNDDSVYVILYNTTDCIPNSLITSNVIHITIAQLVTPSVSITQSPTTICSGTIATFTASPVNGGSTPTYQWKVNDINVGNNSNTYTPSTPVNGNVVKVIMTSSLGCANPPSATSNTITMVVNDSIQEYVSITASATTICAGTTVTFVAAESGSGSGTFQWKLNGNNVGTNSLIYRSDSLHNGDKVKVVFIPTYACSPSQVTSNEIIITVNSAVTSSVSILSSATNICSGQQVTFTATPVNGGSTPSYQWKLNGNNVGSNSPIYQNSALQNSDSVRVVMTSSLASACQPTASSNSIIMSVSQPVIPSVSIISSATTICTGQSVTFTATPTNGGINPVYEWTLNNNAVGSNSPTYQTTTLANGDNIRLTMAPSQSCGSNTPVVSNTITMTVGTGVSPSVSMSASASGICSGSLVTFHASPISGAGNSPSYQWKRNGVNIPGATSSTYQSSSLADGDVIRVAMTSSLSCADPQTVLSHDSVTMTVISVPLIPSVNIEASAINICQGQAVTFTALPTNGGEVPGYQWKLNGINVGNNSEIFESNSLQNGDKVTVEMTSSAACTSSPTATSAPMTMTVAPVMTFYADFDGDGYGNGASGVAQGCTAPAGYVSSNSDCNDDNASVHPGAAEICGNGLDDDCDGQTDETCGNPDNDGDGYTIAQGDCNDNNSSIHPGATEICANSIDDNCNGQTDENCTEALPILMTRTYPAKEGDVGLITLNVEVSLDKAAQLPVSVKYKTINEDAIAGADYEYTSGTLVIPAGKTTGSLQVKIIGDLLRESNERFKINFNDPLNVLLSADPNSRVMIIDNDKGNPNNATTRAEQAPIKEESWKIPNVVRRNQVWTIPQIGNYENEVLIMNIQGQVVNRFINYRNQTSVGHVSVGLYFYRIRIMENPGQYRYYSGRLLITE